MKKLNALLLACCLAPYLVSAQVHLGGEPKQWHKLTLELEGPFARETDSSPNPFTDYRLQVRFTHESGLPDYTVPGYFAADGKAAETSADQGNQWRVHLSPDKPGNWTYRISFHTGKNVALDTAASGQPVAGLDGRSGSFRVAPTDKRGRDFRAHGRLSYVGEHHLRFAGSGQYFLKAGPDAPETFLGYVDFDGTTQAKSSVPLKTWGPHVGDWRDGDPYWKNGRGKGMIGALNYIAAEGCNAFSFLTYNAGGDGDNVWPFVKREDKLHYDCSKLDQWQIVFDHAQRLGLYLHFKLQETENDDNRQGDKAENKTVAAALDGGDLGIERKLYLRELIARFGYLLALNWNLGEENTQSPEQQQAMAAYIRQTDPYLHHIVVHTYPNWQDRVYPPLLGQRSELTGASVQDHWSRAHQRTLKWMNESARAGRPWVVAFDEQNPADTGAPPDPGYQGFSGTVTANNQAPYDLHDIRKYMLWGNLMAGGAGVEYYFGYRLPQNDLNCEDWRSRRLTWNYANYALEFFRDYKVPFWQMRNANALVGNSSNDNSRWCLASHGKMYLVYLPKGGTADIDLSGTTGGFQVRWFNPRTGGQLASGSVKKIRGGGSARLGNPPAEPDQDWLIFITR